MTEGVSPYPCTSRDLCRQFATLMRNKSKFMDTIAEFYLIHGATTSTMIAAHPKIAAAANVVSVSN